MEPDKRYFNRTIKTLWNGLARTWHGGEWTIVKYEPIEDEL